MPSTVYRQTLLAAARRVVVKLGTQVLSRSDAASPGLDVKFLAQMAGQVAGLIARGHEVTMVCSGAIGAGCAELGLKHRPADVAQQQAVAAVGQRRLMTHLHEAFEPHKLKVAQLLLTRTDLDDRVRYLNIRNCVTHLHRMGCVPVFNENDTVAVEELRFGDNDQLSALVAGALGADALLLLTVVDGLLDESGKVIDLVEDVPAVVGLARKQKSKLGTGGIVTKLESARLMAEAGGVAVIAHGREPDILPRLLAGEKLGTVFVAAGAASGRRRLDSRERWIGLTKRPAGTVTIDDGAVAAVGEKGKSLLATGITDTTGRFERGDLLLVRDQRGREVARGLSNYNTDELRLIMGKKSSQFARLLGRPGYAEVIHRDNLVLSNSSAASE